MAERLANIFGTEKDKFVVVLYFVHFCFFCSLFEMRNLIFFFLFSRVNCPFYFKIGACRHGDRCSRLHNRPVISETILFKNMYINPGIMRK